MEIVSVKTNIGIYSAIMCSVIFGIGYLVGVSTAEESTPLSNDDPTHKNSTFNNDTDASQSNIESILAKKIASLQNRIQELESQKSLAAASNPSEIFFNAQKTEPASDNELIALRNYQMNNEIEKHKQRLQTMGATSENIAETVNNHFLEEPVDSEWAQEKKANLDNFIMDDAALYSLSNISSECRSQQCKISILSDDPNHLNNLHDSINRLMSKQAYFTSYITVVDEKSRTTNVFVSNDISSALKNH